jgi:serine/threonine protein phosphatase PrpC
MGNLLVADPFTLERKLESDDDFIIIASDGLWDVCTPEQACKIIYEWKEKSSSGTTGEGEKIAVNAGAALADYATSQNSADNISVLVLFLKEKGSGARLDKSEILVD